MDFAISKNPMIGAVHCKSVNEHFSSYIDLATNFNIATGFISTESIVELKRIVDYRDGSLNLSLFIGMNYIDGFTKPQYQAAKELHQYLIERQLGQVFVSPRAKFHGKLYSFTKESECLGSFIGSSNLSSFIGTSQDLIETDLHLGNQDGILINKKIVEITNILGEPISSADEITDFKTPDIKLLDGFEHVKKLTEEQITEKLTNLSEISVAVPLKVDPKSNLNTFFGAGKNKGKYSPRGWYEVEVIVGKRTPNVEYLPDKEMGPFTVVTFDGYEFQCERQGDYSKNLRSCLDLKILGRWIKGHMEVEGALKVGTPVTEETLSKFGKRSLVFTKSKDGAYWFLKFA